MICIGWPACKLCSSPSAKSQNRSSSLHPLSEKLSFTEGLGWVILSTETGVGRSKGGSFCQNDEDLVNGKTVCVSMATRSHFNRVSGFSNEQLVETPRCDSPRRVSVHIRLKVKLSVLRTCYYSLLLARESRLWGAFSLRRPIELIQPFARENLSPVVATVSRHSGKSFYWALALSRSCYASGKTRLQQWLTAVKSHLC